MMSLSFGKSLISPVSSLVSGTSSAPLMCDILYASAPLTSMMIALPSAIIFLASSTLTRGILSSAFGGGAVADCVADCAVDAPAVVAPTVGVDAPDFAQPAAVIAMPMVSALTPSFKIIFI